LTEADAKKRAYDRKTGGPLSKTRKTKKDKSETSASTRIKRKKDLREKEIQTRGGRFSNRTRDTLIPGGREKRRKRWFGKRRQL